MLDALFQPFKVGQTEVRNRIVLPPMITFLANESGAVTQRMIDYYTERARGGAGLIIVEAAYVQEKERDFGRLGIENPQLHVGLSELAESIQEQGAKVLLQINSRGSVLSIHKGKGPDDLNLEEIEAIIEAFAEAAWRARRAGFDGVEIHGSNKYLIAQFFSPLTNHRQDEYGGDQEGRIKFARDILLRVRQRVGNAFTVTYRMVGSEHTEGGITLGSAQLFARRMEESGADALHVAPSPSRVPYVWVPPMAIPRGCNVPLAEGIKKVVEIPVIAVGRINDPALANEIVATGKADLVAMGRALIADPYLPRKAKAGELEEIRKCLACNFCRQRSQQFRTRRCAINAQAGQERDRRITPAPISRKVMVVGGGPAGMEATRVLTLRGHRVVLYEKGSQLGGQVNLAVIPPHKEELQNILDYLIFQVKKLNIAVHLNQEVTREIVSKEAPDAIILAAGALPVIPQIPGLAREMVYSAEEALRGTRNLGAKILMMGGGMVGCEAAEFLASQGKEVTIVEILPELAITMEGNNRILLLERLAKLAVKILTGSEILRFDGTRAVIRKDDKNFELKVEGVIAALGSRANRSCAELESCGLPFYTIGDAVSTRDIAAAIHEGFRAAMEI
jgi:2,4-dienoyl-CoA reductase-like NADH-dependent reductase (Old Yellow Enzyme family)/thioredoxin reductase